MSVSTPHKQGRLVSKLWVVSSSIQIKYFVPIESTSVIYHILSKSLFLGYGRLCDGTSHYVTRWPRWVSFGLAHWWAGSGKTRSEDKMASKRRNFKVSGISLNKRILVRNTPASFVASRDERDDVHQVHTWASKNINLHCLSFLKT